MAGQRISKWLKHHLRLPLFLFLVVLSLGTVLLISYGEPLTTWLQTWPVFSQDPVVSTSPNLAATPSLAASPIPTPSLSPPAKRSGGKQGLKPSPPEPTLTTEQQAAQEQQQQAAIAALEASIPTVDSLMEMQVALEVDASSAVVSVSSEASLLDQDGNTLETLVPNTTYTAEVSGQSLLFNGSSVPELVWVEPPVGGQFVLNQRTYRGRLLLAVENARLWVVNFVSMRNYLYSVVASEVSPSWNEEALKAQAVAARSYGMTYYFNPVNSLYQLGDDEYFQVYSGTATEDDRVRKAVDATAGEFVSYHGGVVESLYAASDEIVKEAFQGKGMSQLGALELAEEGYSYQEILSKYYPGTNVGRIEQDF